MLLIKILLIIVLSVITYQDLKDREVYLFTFPILIGALGFLHFQSVLHIHFWYAIGINIGVVSFCMMITYFYATFILKRSFFKEAFGLGDLLFFIALAIGFPTVTFIVLLVFSLLFALIAWLFLKKTTQHKTVPLAGFMSIFIGVIFITHWVTNTLTLYII